MTTTDLPYSTSDSVEVDYPEFADIFDSIYDWDSASSIAAERTVADLYGYGEPTNAWRRYVDLREAEDTAD